VRLISQSERIIILTGAGISALFCVFLCYGFGLVFDLLFFRFLSFHYSALDLGVSCGIPDFRSRDGLYASLKDGDEYELDDPQQM
jgi:NAD-dependent histone deacetylase SIR2